MASTPLRSEWWVFRRPTGQADFEAGRDRDLFVTTAGMVTAVGPEFFEIDDGDEDPVELWYSEGWEPLVRIPEDVVSA